MSHERWHDSVAPYLLGALEDPERASFEEHLAECPECRREVGFLGIAAAALPASPPQLDPPPELKDRIMGVVRAEAELLHAAGAGADRPALAPRRRRGWWSVRPAWALAAAVVILAVGVAAGGLLDGGDGPPRTVVAQVDVPGATAQLEWRDGHVDLVAHGLPHPGADRVYQVWLKRPGRPPQATDALFTTGRDGSAAVQLTASMKGVEAVLVTREPEGGSTVPSEAPVISAPIA